MKTMVTAALAGAAVGALGLAGVIEASAQQQPQVNDAPLQDDWWTGNQEFGADDMVGAIQRIGPQDIMDALKLVKQGKAATLAGVAIPLLFVRLGFDPAVTSGVCLTTVTDVVGFFTFLGLAAWSLT